MPLHIGIVACSAEGAALCFRTICAEGAALLGPHNHPEVSLHSLPLSEYVRRLNCGDMHGVADLMLGSAGRLASIGADFMVCPDNTIHLAFGQVEARSRWPWIHIADGVAIEAARRGFKRLALLGTRWTIDGPVYPDRLAPHAIECVRPSAEERDRLHEIIMDELVYGVFKPESVAYFVKVISGLKDAGCDAVILGCTEIPLIINDANSALPTLDSPRLLARAALRRSLSDGTKPA